MEVDVISVGQYIRNLRLSKKMTQKQLGELAGIAEPTIRRYESGKLNPKIETLRKIANALDVHVFDLLGIGEKTDARKPTALEIGSEIVDGKSGKLSGQQIIEETAMVLLEFVKRAGKAGAAPAEVEALPETARVLFELCKYL